LAGIRFMTRPLKRSRRRNPQLVIDDKTLLLLGEDLPREAGDIADASASVPSSSGYRATLHTLFRGKMSGAGIALAIR